MNVLLKNCLAEAQDKINLVAGSEILYFHRITLQSPILTLPFVIVLFFTQNRFCKSMG